MFNRSRFWILIRFTPKYICYIVAEVDYSQFLCFIQVRKITDKNRKIDSE
jgi:hypothetical protein